MILFNTKYYNWILFNFILFYNILNHTINATDMFAIKNLFFVTLNFIHRSRVKKLKTVLNIWKFGFLLKNIKFQTVLDF